MPSLSNADLVCLLLDEATDGDGDALSTRAIGESLGMDGTLAGEIELVAALRHCLADDLAGLSEGGLDERGARTRITPTPAGMERAEALRDRLDDETVTVLRGGERRSVPVMDLDEVVPEVPRARALAHTSAEGVVRLPDRTTEEFLDRTDALTTLTTHLDAVVAGTSRAVVLTGEHGIGKTRVARALLDRATDRPLQVLEGSGRGPISEPYHVFRTALGEYRDRAPDRLFERSDVPEAGDLQERRRSVFHDVASFLATLAADRPVVLFLDHLEAADRASIALFEFLAGEVGDAPVYLLGAVEPEGRPADHGFGEGAEPVPSGAERLHLEGFDRETTASFLQRRLGDPAVPASFVDAIHSHTGGNPLFLDASLSYLQDRGILDVRTGHYPSGAAALDVPDRVQRVILERVEGLDDKTATVLSWGSVVGETVPLSVLEAVVVGAETDPAIDGEALETAIDRLTSLGVWTRPDRDTLRFASGVVRDVVHGRLDEEVRSARHERVATAMEGVYGEDRPAHAADVAAHYEAAGRPHRAIEGYRRAGDHAAGVYAHESAVEAYEAALSIAREAGIQTAELELLEELGRVHFRSGDYEEADRYCQYVAERTDAVSRRRRVASRRARIRTEWGEYEQCIDLVDDALADWDGETPREAVCTLLGRKAWALSQLGEVDRADELASRTLEMARTLENQELVARSHRTLGVLEYQYGDIREAIDRYERTAEAAREADAPHLLAAAYNNLGGPHQLLGDLEASRRTLERSYELYDEFDNALRGAVPLGNLGTLHVAMGNLDRARDHLDAAVERGQRFDLEVNLAYLASFRGELELVAGNLAAAEEALAAAVERADEIGHDRARTNADVNRIALYRFLDDVDRALDLAETVMDRAGEGEMDIRGQAGYRRGQLLRERGRTDAAIEVHEALLEAAGPGDPWDAAVHQQIGLAEALVAAGRVAEAADHAEEALATADETGNRIVPMTARRTLAVVRARQGDVDAATDQLETALSTAREVGAQTVETSLLLARGDVLADHEPAAARDALETAADLAAETGARLHERRAESALVDLPDAAE